jgi:phosphate transport system permease protein
VILVAGGQLASLDLDAREPHQNMAAFIADVSRSDVSNSSAEFQTIFAVGTTLFLMTLILNFISIRFVRKYRQVYE